MNKLDSIFYPKTIAIIGASRKPGSVGHSLLANLIDSRFQGIVYPVNPKAKGILGIKCYHNVIEIPDIVDLAVIIVPVQFVPGVLEECGKKGIKGVIIITAGFKEIGGQGIKAEKVVWDICKKYEISLVGPNCLGVMNTSPLPCRSKLLRCDEHISSVIDECHIWHTNATGRKYCFYVPKRSTLCRCPGLCKGSKRWLFYVHQHGEQGRCQRK